MSHVDYPFTIDARGGTALTGDADHVRDLIEQILFTAPGERVNRPGFGSGILQVVFAPNNDTLAATIETGVKAALEKWISDMAEIESIEAEVEDARLTIALAYRMRRTGERRQTRLERAL